MASEDSARIFVPPPLIYLTGLLVGLALDARLKLDIPSAPLWERLAALLLAVAGVSVVVAGLRRFRSSETAPEPWKPSSALVNGGIYRFTRNPMYLGFTLFYAALALLFRSPAAGVILIAILAIMNFIVIAREEAYLQRRFGPAYQDYKARVRRWI
jgi:protein-S-isoprenylcysteine O-methyltransferase Ste14